MNRKNGRSTLGICSDKADSAQPATRLDPERFRLADSEFDLVVDDAIAGEAGPMAHHAVHAGNDDEDNPVPRHRPGEEFLCGPVPAEWLRIAGRHGGKALQVGLELWVMQGIKKRATLRLSYRRLEQRWGVNRWAAYRAAKWLEQHGLISVARHPGRCPEVTLLMHTDRRLSNPS